MSVYWSHDKTHATTHLDLVKALNCLRPSQDMKVYRLIIKTWNNISIALLQCARNVQTISEALVYNRIRTSNRLTKDTRAPYTIPEQCGIILVQMLLPACMCKVTKVSPTTNPVYTTPCSV